MPNIFNGKCISDGTIEVAHSIDQSLPLLTSRPGDNFACDVALTTTWPLDSTARAVLVCAREAFLNYPKETAISFEHFIELVNMSNPCGGMATNFDTAVHVELKRLPLNSGAKGVLTGE